MPTEILRLMLFFLDSHSLLALTAVSQLYHDIASPLYLQLYHEGFPSQLCSAQSTSLVVSGSSIPALHIWRRCTNFATLMEFSCTFNPVDEAISREEAVHVERFLDSLGQIPLARSVHLSTYTLPASEVLQVLHRLPLSECNTLYIHGSPTCTPSLNETVVLPSPLDASNLRHICLVSSTPFSEELLPRTLSLIINSSLESLSIARAHLASHQWASIFSLITIPTLTSFDVGSSLQWDAFTAFLNRHGHSLRHLSISQHSQVHSKASRAIKMCQWSRYDRAIDRTILAYL